jgi:hypothetical protein
VSIPPSPKTAEELLALPELAVGEPIFAIRATDAGAVFLFRVDGKTYGPVYANSQWWKQEQWIP